MKVNRINRMQPRATRQTPEDNKFYHSKGWRMVRREYILNNPLCEECSKKGIVKEGSMVDHIIPVLLGGSKFSLLNLQTLCSSCHASKSAKERR